MLTLRMTDKVGFHRAGGDPKNEIDHEEVAPFGAAVILKIARTEKRSQRSTQEAPRR